MRQFNSIMLNQPELIALNEHTLESQAAQKIWLDIAPEGLANLSYASSIKNKQFTLFANNNAVAAKIKIFTPSLLIKLEKKGYEVTSIRVKVQVKSTHQAKIKTPKKLSAHAANELNLLSQKISGTPLGEALAKLVTKT